jgi:hypothetical protein
MGGVNPSSAAAVAATAKFARPTASKRPSVPEQVDVDADSAEQLLDRSDHAAPSAFAFQHEMQTCR